MRFFGVILLLCLFVGCISDGICMNQGCNIPCDGTLFGFDNIIYSPINSCFNSASFGYQIIYNNEYTNIEYFRSIKFPFYMTRNISLIFHCITTDISITSHNIRGILTGNNISNEHIIHRDSIRINEYIEGSEYILPNKCLLNSNNDTHEHALIWEFNGNGNVGLYKTCNNYDNIGSIGYGSLKTSCNIPDVYILNTQFVFEFMDTYPNQETSISPTDKESSFCDYYIFCGTTNKGKAATLAFIVLAFICVILILLLCVSIYVTRNYIKLKKLQNAHQNNTAVNIPVPYMDRERVTTMSTISTASSEDNKIRKKSINLFPETRGAPEYLDGNNDDNSNVPPPPLPPVIPVVPATSSDESNNSHDKLKLNEFYSNENGIIKQKSNDNIHIK
mmetsp:Transcript_103793/g.126866  ORF Transcript_103793/g.126866 Transcript_103793/m.126866 type:complete len:390 (+) Transcript_103793:39-1208(+)